VIECLHQVTYSVVWLEVDGCLIVDPLSREHPGAQLPAGLQPREFLAAPKKTSGWLDTGRVQVQVQQGPDRASKLQQAPARARKLWLALTGAHLNSGQDFAVLSSWQEFAGARLAGIRCVELMAGIPRSAALLAEISWMS
jgi:hypothetical protein